MHTPRSIQALYLHIPFCAHICPFCAFSVLKDSPEKHQKYFELLQKEFELINNAFKLDFKGLKSIYIGGGTPSRLTLKELEALFIWMNDKLEGANPVEFSIELNPEDVTVDLLKLLKDRGVNRLSLGIQSFNDFALSLLERNNNKKSNYKAIDLIERAGFDNFNLDFLYGWPGQSFASFKEDLQLFLELSPRHLSAYLLELELKSKSFKRPLWNEWAYTQDELFEKMYLHAGEEISKIGIQQYEVSNYSQPGYESAQNISNWSGENYLGLGLGAHSYLGPYRFGNLKQFAKYQKELNMGYAPQDYIEELTEINILDEKIMVGLRQTKGIPLSLLDSFPRESVHNYLNMITTANWATVEKGNLRLTPKGLLIADTIAIDITCLDQT